MSNHKSRDNTLMWESFTGDPSFPEHSNSSEFEDESDFGDGMDFGSDFDEPEVVMEIDPIGPVDVEEESDEDNKMIYSDVKKLVEYSGRLLELVKKDRLEPWMLAKLVKASDYVTDVWYSLDANADFANTGFKQADDLSQF